MSDDEHITESDLGTKSYWDDFYNTELENFENNGNCGETWFGKPNTHKIIEWIAERCGKTSKFLLVIYNLFMILFGSTGLICDIGCGNGYMLSKLACKGFLTSMLVGIDYSEQAINFCKKLYSQNDITKDIRFEVVDILQNNFTSEKFDIIIDKGTYDAICLMPNGDIQLNRQKYWYFITKHLKNENSYFVIMSCNFTKEELLKFLLQNDAFQLIHEFETPKLLFGGKEGSQVTGLVMKWTINNKQ